MGLSSFLRQNICLIGICILAYAVFDAVSNRELLQGGAHDDSEELPNVPHPSLFVAYLRTSIVALVGMLLTTFGFVLRSNFQKARLVDFNKHARYDQFVKTKVNFAHFNHRGSVGRTLNHVSGDAKGSDEKKKA
ncbi:hypothetical protein STCU_05634 [Strigomonas culicis]|uniref:Membrane magnesium transporter n=1 Tax=Strigomonas culicis TaxID=28005 RepID=S9VKR5_9TRYP|nr:hypothetical protein STCU_05634 [Strigomonas culicis]|eukprot:EPY27671.1 hypothetical protein STCU_05634 [Strigomonas culicis]